VTRTNNRPFPNTAETQKRSWRSTHPTSSHTHCTPGALSPLVRTSGTWPQGRCLGPDRLAFCHGPAWSRDSQRLEGMLWWLGTLMHTELCIVVGIVPLRVLRLTSHVNCCANSDRQGRCKGHNTVAHSATAELDTPKDSRSPPVSPVFPSLPSPPLIDSLSFSLFRSLSLRSLSLSLFRSFSRSLALSLSRSLTFSFFLALSLFLSLTQALSPYLPLYFSLHILGK